jgi:hypothetical protein
VTGVPEPDPPAASPAPDAAAARRPLIERIGMALIAAVVATTFAGVAAASFSSGEPFLGIMALLGALMTAWVGILTLVRG